MIKLGYEMQFRLVRLRNRVWLRELLGIEMHLRLVVSRLTICARRRRLDVVVCYHPYKLQHTPQRQPHPRGRGLFQTSEGEWDTRVTTTNTRRSIGED